MVVGNPFAEAQFKKWFVERTESGEKRRLSWPSICFIVGPSGVGKSHFVKAMCEELHIATRIIDSQNFVSYRDFTDRLMKWTISDITTQFEQIQKEKKVMILEELETITTMDRTFIGQFQKLLDTQQYPDMPVIITSQNFDRKKYHEFYTRSHMIELRIAEPGDIFLFLRQQAPTLSADILLDIAEQCHGSIGQAINMVQMRTPKPSDQPVKKSNRGRKPKGYVREVNSSEMDVIPNMSDVYETPSIDKARIVMWEDPWLHPLRFHENIPFELSQRKGATLKRQEVYSNIMQGLCIWDRWMTHFRGEDPAIPIEFICHHVAQLNSLERKKTAEVAPDQFTKMFSHLSLEKKNLVANYEKEDGAWQHIGNYHRVLYEKAKKSKSFSTKKVS